MPAYRVMTVWYAIGLIAMLAGRLVHGQDIDFSHQVAPLLKTHCLKCHGGPQREGGFSLNSRESLLVGGDSGLAVISGDHTASEFYRRIHSTDDGYRMPPEGGGLSAEQAEILARWIDQGLTWEPGFSFAPAAYEPPLRPRRPDLPPVHDGREHPLDRILDQALQDGDQAIPQPITDDVFLRRVMLDLVGLLPTPEQRRAFLQDSTADKRSRLVDELLQQSTAYADHWLTFWNDLLRNDYTGTGFITGGRTQITTWLYESLLTNKPYDQFARELIAPPSPDSAGFINGIRWRGEVSAGQTVEIQFAQSVGQAFLGINLKCASCHDSFVDRWTLDEAFGLAAVYSETPLELHRCDKPLGKIAQAQWLFPELGGIDPAATKAERLRQLADLMTHPENGRFTRTVVNRLWHRLMGRGIVHPTDAMQTEPWNHDLLDYLAVHLSDHGYDLKQTLRLIVTSQAYQSQVEAVQEANEVNAYVYAGPRAKRLTAEQFLDAVWQLTGAAPSSSDAVVTRNLVADERSARPTRAHWIWNRSRTLETPAGQTLAFRKTWNLLQVPQRAFAVVSCDNEYDLYLNGRRLAEGNRWETPDLIPLEGLLVGSNQLLIVGRNGGNNPNPAGLFCDVYFSSNGTVLEDGFGTDESWQWSANLPDEARANAQVPEDWRAAVITEHPDLWAAQIQTPLVGLIERGLRGEGPMVRAALVKSDFLMRSLGRPNRDQIVTVRPAELTTLEAIDLAIGETLDGYLQRGGQRLAHEQWQDPAELVRWLFHHSLSRDPSAHEMELLTESLETPLNAEHVADVLWSIVMLPEFQIVR
jgi:hypothetical protein